MGRWSGFPTTSRSSQGGCGLLALAPIPSAALSASRVEDIADLEAVFLGRILADVATDPSSDDPLGGSDDPFGVMLSDERGKLVGRQSGIADAVLRQPLGTQEVR